MNSGTLRAMFHVKNQALRFSIIFIASLGMASCGASDWLYQKMSGNKSSDDLTLERTTPWVESDETTPKTVPWKNHAIAANTFTQIAKTADPGVVNIGTTQIIKNGDKQPPLFGGPGGPGGQQSPFDDLFRHFFGGDNMPGEQPEVRRPSLGSGFILNKEGYIVTNNHVVEKASEIKVTIGQDREYEAKIVGTDPKTDVALIKIEAKEELTPLVLGDSDSLEVGEIVVAIGNPFGFSHTVTQGIVSAKERTIGFGPYDNFIQTDASINPGNSGGPLLNMEAKVVGINTAIIASGQGIGFAIPINLAKNIIQQLKDTGTVTRGWLGVQIQKVDPDLAKSLGLDAKRGALVSSVQEGSPALKAGIKTRDVILKVGDIEIRGFEDLPRHVANLPIGEKVELTLLRDGKEVKVHPVIEKQPKDMDSRGQAPESDTSQNTGDKPDKIGMIVESLTLAEAKRLDLPTDQKGVRVRYIDGSSEAAQKGVRRGDVILEINKKPISSVTDYQGVVKGIDDQGSVLIYLQRPGSGPLFVAFTLSASE